MNKSAVFSSSGGAVGHSTAAISCFVREPGFAFTSWIPAVIVVEGTVLKRFELDRNGSQVPSTTMSLKGASIQGIFDPESNYQHNGAQYFSLVIHGKPPRPPVLSLYEQNNLPTHMHLGFKTSAACLSFYTTILGYLAARGGNNLSKSDPELEAIAKFVKNERSIELPFHQEQTFENKSHITFDIPVVFLQGILKSVLSSLDPKKSKVSLEVICNHFLIDGGKSKDDYILHFIHRSFRTDDSSKFTLSSKGAKSDFLIVKVAIIACLFNYILLFFTSGMTFSKKPKPFRKVFFRQLCPSKCKLSCGPSKSKRESYCIVETSEGSNEEHEAFAKALKFCVEERIWDVYLEIAGMLPNDKWTLVTYRNFVSQSDESSEFSVQVAEVMQNFKGQKGAKRSDALRFLIASDWRVDRASELLNMFLQISAKTDPSSVSVEAKKIITLNLSEIFSDIKASISEITIVQWVSHTVRHIEQSFTQQRMSAGQVLDPSSVTAASNLPELRLDCSNFTWSFDYKMNATAVDCLIGCFSCLFALTPFRLRSVTAVNVTADFVFMYLYTDAFASFHAGEKPLLSRHI